MGQKKTHPAPATLNQTTTFNLCDRPFCIRAQDQWTSLRAFNITISMEYF